MNLNQIIKAPPLRPGIIYILRSSSLRGTVVKIRKTTRTAEERAAEISGSTGVPTAYEVLYEEEVLDSDQTEILIHRALGKYRVNRRREFFDLPLKDAVRAVFNAVLVVNQSISESSTRLVVLSRSTAQADEFTTELLRILRDYRGGPTNVYLLVQRPSYSGNIALGHEWSVSCEPEPIKRLKSVRGVDDVVLCSGTSGDVI